MTLLLHEGTLNLANVSEIIVLTIRLYY